MTNELAEKQLNLIDAITTSAVDAVIIPSVTDKQPIWSVAPDMNNRDNLKDFIEAMIKYHWGSSKGCIDAEYNRKNNARIRKSHPELLKELVEAKVWNNASWHRGAVTGLLEVYDIMHFGKTGATLLSEITGITDVELYEGKAN